MDRIGAGRGVFDAQVITEEGTCHIIGQVTLGTSEFETRLHGIEASSVNINTPSCLVVGLGIYFDHSRRTKAVLGRQGTIKKFHPIYKPGVQRLAESTNPLGQYNAINAVLNIGVVTTHMKLAERVIGHAWCLEQYLVKGRVVPLG